MTLVEHPARIECGTALAVTLFGPSYRRAAIMQALLAAIAFLASIGAWVSASSSAWLLGGILIVTVVPFTLIAILPTNKKLLDPLLDRNSDVSLRLLKKWGRLHAIRTLVGTLAFVVLLLSQAVSSD